MNARRVVLGLALALAGCDWNAAEEHARCVSTGECDAGRPDAGPVVDDGGFDDAGVRDAGSDDAGAVDDAGTPDAGRLDGGSDGGTPDAGFPDAGRDAGTPDAGPAVDAGLVHYTVEGDEPIALFRKNADLWVVTRSGNSAYASLVEGGGPRRVHTISNFAMAFANDELNEQLLAAQTDGTAYQLFASGLTSNTTGVRGPGFRPSIVSVFVHAINGNEQLSYWHTDGGYFQTVIDNDNSSIMPIVLSDPGCTGVTLTDIEVLPTALGGGALIGWEHAGAACSASSVAAGIGSGSGFQTITPSGLRDGGSFGPGFSRMHVGAGQTRGEVVGQYTGGFRWQPVGLAAHNTTFSGALTVGDVSFGKVSVIASNGTFGFSSGSQLPVGAQPTLLLLDVLDAGASRVIATGVPPQDVLPVLVHGGYSWVLYNDSAGDVVLTRVDP